MPTPAWVRRRYVPRTDPKAAKDGESVYALLLAKRRLEEEERFCVDPARLAEIRAELVKLGLRDG